MKANTVFILDYIVAKQHHVLVGLDQGFSVDCRGEIKRKRRLYGYDFS